MTISFHKINIWDRVHTLKKHLSFNTGATSEFLSTVNQHALLQYFYSNFTEQIPFDRNENLCECKRTVNKHCMLTRCPTGLMIYPSALYGSRTAI